MRKNRVERVEMVFNDGTRKVIEGEAARAWIDFVEAAKDFYKRNQDPEEDVIVKEPAPESWIRLVPEDPQL